MAEVVGTAFVRIRAITKQLSKEIQDGVDKGIKDAKIDESGEVAGESFSDGFTESSSKGIGDGLKDTFDDDDHERAAKDGGERGGTSWASGFKDKLDTSIGESVTEVFIRSRGDRERAVRVGGERDGETYGEGFRDGVDRDRNVFSGIFSSIGRGLSGVFDGLGSIFGGGGGGGFFGLLGFGKDDGDAEKKGQSRGVKIGKGVLSGVTKALSGAASITAGLLFNPVTIIGGLVTAIGPLLINSIVGITSQLGTLVQGALGGILGLGAGLGAGLLALGPLIAAFTAETPLLELFKEEMSAIGEEFKVTAEIVQEQVLPGVLLLAETFVDTLLPLVDEFAFRVGDAFGDFTEALSDLIALDSSVGRINAILGNSSEGFRRFLQALIPFTDAFLTFFAAVSQLAPVLADDLNEIFTRLNDNLSTRGVQGLADTFRGLYDTFTLVLGGLSDLTIALYNVLAIGDSATGQGFFERFRDFARDFREFTVSDSGVARIQEIFERAQPVLSEFAGLISDVFGLLFSGATSEGAAGATVSFLQFLREDAIPWLTETGFPALSTGVGAVSDVVGTVVEALTPFFTSLYESFEPVVTEIFGYFEDRAPDVLNTLTQALADMEEPLANIGDAFARGLGTMFEALKAFAETGAFDALVQAFVLLVEIIADLVSIPGVAEFLGLLGAAFLIFKSIAAIVGPLITGLTALGTAIATVAGLFGIAIGLPAAVIGAIAVAIGLAVYAIIRNWDSIIDFFTETVPEVFSNFLDWVTEDFVPKFLDGLGKIGSFFSDIGGVVVDGLASAGGAIVDFVTSIPGLLVRFGGILLRGFGEAIMTVARELPRLLGNLLKAFLDLQLDIAFGLLGLGVDLLAAFVSAVGTVIYYLVTDGIPAVVAFFTELPGNVAEALASLGEFLLEKFVQAVTAVINFLITEIPKVVQFFIDLPGTIFDAFVSFAKDFAAFFLDAMTSAKDFVVNGFADIVSAITGFIGNIPTYAGQVFDAMVGFGKSVLNGLKDGVSGAASFLGDAIGDIAGSVWEGIKSFLNDAIDRLEDALSFKIEIGPFSKDISVNLPEFAVGGIFTRPTAGILGEAGKEVLLPLTDPVRSYQLALKSGLFDVLSKGARASGAVPVVLPASGGSTFASSTSGRRAVVFEPGAIVVHAQNASASQVADEVARRLDWALTTRDDR